MENPIEQMAELLKEGDTYVCWTGVYFDQKYKFIRADKLFLNIITMREGVPRFQRVVRVTRKNRYGEPYLCFDSSQDAYKITKGIRKGKVMYLEGIGDNEGFRVAGIKKKLALDKQHGFDLKRPGDQIIAKLIQGLANICSGDEDVLTVDIKDCLPNIFLTRKADPNDRDDIFMRKSGGALRVIRSSPVYNTMERLDVNFLNILPRLACDAGEGRIGYPYDIAYGRGVLAASVAGRRGNLGMWYKVYSLETSLPEIEVR